LGVKIKAKTSHIDPNLDLNKAKSCHLSIQVNLNEFSFAILNLHDQKYIALEHYDIKNNTSYSNLAEQIDLIINKQKLLKLNFVSTSVGIAHNFNTITPKALYEEENGNDILSFNHILLQNEKETRDWIQTIQAFNSYFIPEELERCFNKHFKNILWKHNSSILIESLIHQFKLQEGERIYISIQNKSFDVTILETKYLKFFNSFSYRAAEDLIYYLLFTFEQLQLNPNQTPLIISGEIEEDSDVYKLLFKYIRNISFTKRNPNYNYSFVLDQIKEHFYYELLNQHLCVS